MKLKLRDVWDALSHQGAYAPLSNVKVATLQADNDALRAENVALREQLDRVGFERSPLNLVGPLCDCGAKLGEGSRCEDCIEVLIQEALEGGAFR